MKDGYLFQGSPARGSRRVLQDGARPHYAGAASSTNFEQGADDGDIPAAPKFIDLLLDSAFKRAFVGTGDGKVLLPFLQMLLPERRIRSIRYENTEHVNSFAGKKDVRIDVECTSEDGSRFIVELQRERQDFFIERTFYYSTFAVQMQMPKGRGRTYGFMPVYVISLVNFTLEGSEPGKAERRCHFTWDGTGEVAMSSLTFIFIELPNHRPPGSPEATRLDKFCYLLRNMAFFRERPDTEGDALLESLVDCADFTTLAESEKIKYINDMTTERDIYNQIAYAREEGEKAGLEKGLEKGRTEGLEMAARNMLRMGMPPEQVSAATGIEISKLTGHEDQ